MALILLTNFDEPSAHRLADLLTRRGHRVNKCSTFDGVQFLEASDHDLDLIILDVSHDDRETQNQLAEIRHYRAQHGPRPMLLCVSRLYRGARFQLDLESKGARVVYVR